jgi:pyrimidine-nucleoside phosphorylase
MPASETSLLSIIEAKRDGRTLSAEQITAVVQGAANGKAPDYQLAAWLMAVFFRGMNREETRALTLAMRDSGEVLRFPPDPRPLVDKHSTGGVGDKVSLVLAPLLACLGFRVPMISGRGLGITGGTLDKLDSIPGFRTGLDAAEIVDLVQRVGCVICGQTGRMVPADRALYALRDVTGTVPSVPLITASILSKKLAEGISALVLDIKVGPGTLMQTPESARDLATSLVALGEECGVKTRALLTDMNTPLGRAAGNWLEVKEAVGCLDGPGPADLRNLVVACAAHLLAQTGRAEGAEEGRAVATACLDSGAPRRKWDEMLAAQGADDEVFRRRLDADALAPAARELKAERAGYVIRCDARVVGGVVRNLGGGRLTKGAAIQPDVGLDALAKPGDQVDCGSLLARVHAADENQVARAIRDLAPAFEIADAPPGPAALIREVIGAAEPA